VPEVRVKVDADPVESIPGPVSVAVMEQPEAQIFVFFRAVRVSPAELRTQKLTYAAALTDVEVPDPLSTATAESFAVTTVGRVAQ